MERIWFNLQALNNNLSPQKQSCANTIKTPPQVPTTLYHIVQPQTSEHQLHKVNLHKNLLKL